MLVLAVIATTLIVYGGDSASTTATVGRRRHGAWSPHHGRASHGSAAASRDGDDADAAGADGIVEPHRRPTSSPEPTPTPAVDPRTVVYSVTGTKQVFDVVSIIYTDAQGLPQTDFNVSLPWSKTIVLNPGVQTKSVIATSLAGRLNCAITTADGQMVAASTNNTIIATCAR
ncbi:conserved membrane family protein [Mycobacterium xenopi 4042]|uniref:Conserved membrane family protein n=1 Tax=Mycobacterium xenopi 4042 TaxID=1299334 RepID=X7YJ38_MYCXE|nr:conserved membrane family protein [Mycobacterium xenopi 4042]